MTNTTTTDSNATLTAAALPGEQMIDTLRRLAAAAVAAYPQYAGHFTNYRLVQIKRPVTTKMGLAFARGEFAIAASAVRGIIGDRYVTVWSLRNQIDTSVPAGAVEWL